MSKQYQQMSTAARQAVQAKRWPQVAAIAREMIGRSRDHAEGHFLLGLAEAAANKSEQAGKAFSRALAVDSRRYDAAVELAALYMRSHRYGDATALLDEHVGGMQGSPLYLDKAGTIYSNVGLPEKAWPLYQRANELQPGVPTLQANLAACNVYVGQIDAAIAIYSELLEKAPQHQRNHYELSRLKPAKDSHHVEQMESVLATAQPSPEKNIYLYYALGKELEDLQRWDESFSYLEKAGAAALSVSDYDVDADIELIDTVIKTCNADWLANEPRTAAAAGSEVTPVFIVGLPRSGTTLTERIVSSHSEVESIGESFFMQIVLKAVSRVPGPDGMSPEIITAAASKDIERVANGYLSAIAYRLEGKPRFIEKFPENFLYLGFIAKAFPQAKIVHVQRNPMDSCFALFKQSFFRYAYSLSDLGAYYAAYHRLHRHWRELLGERLIEVRYEQLIADQEGETRRLLDALGLDFEAGCLSFEKNAKASNTASTVQIREKIHSRSVNRWMHYEKHLLALADDLQAAGIDVHAAPSGNAPG